MKMGELLDRALFLYRKNFALLLAISAVFMLPYSAAYLAIHARSKASFVSRLALTEPIGIVAASLAEGAIAYAVLSMLRGHRPSLSAAVQFAVRRADSLIWLGLWKVCLEFLAMAAFIVPGVYLWCRWSVAIPAMVEEGLPAAPALKRSRQLTEEHRRRALLLLGVYLFFAFLPAITWTLAYKVLTASPAPQLATRLVSLLATVIITPWIVSALTLFYADLRTRKEAFDLQLMLDNPSPTEASTGVAEQSGGTARFS